MENRFAFKEIYHAYMDVETMKVWTPLKIEVILSNGCCISLEFAAHPSESVVKKERSK